MQYLAETDRIYLRELLESDIDSRYLSFFEDKELIKFYSGTKREYTQAAILKDIENGKQTQTYFIYGIFLKENNLCIGNIKVGPIVVDHKISDLVALIGDRNCHGKGLAVEAISLGNKIAFEKHDIRKLYGGMFESNISAIKAYTKAGWIIEGKLKGHYWVDQKPVDRVLVGCFNPKYFNE